jgi:hypothetical protein
VAVGDAGFGLRGAIDCLLVVFSSLAVGSMAPLLWAHKDPGNDDKRATLAFLKFSFVMLCVISGVMFFFVQGMLLDVAQGAITGVRHHELSLHVNHGVPLLSLLAAFVILASTVPITLVRGGKCLRLVHEWRYGGGAWVNRANPGADLYRDQVRQGKRKDPALESAKAAIVHLMRIPLAAGMAGAIAMIAWAMFVADTPVIGYWVAGAMLVASFHRPLPFSPYRQVKL